MRRPKQNPVPSSPGATEAPKPDAPAPVLTQDTPTTEKLRELGDKFQAEQQTGPGSGRMPADGSPRHPKDCTCEKCEINRRRREAYAAKVGRPVRERATPTVTTRQADNLANLAMDQKVKDWNKGLMKFFADLLKSEQPSEFEIALTEEGAVELFHMMSKNVQQRFMLIAFVSGWGIFLTPRIMEYMKKRKEEAVTEKAKLTGYPA